VNLACAHKDERRCLGPPCIASRESLMIKARSSSQLHARAM
jgi:hypothetical protein